MIKVAFNSLPLKTGHKARGIGFYTKHLLAELIKNPEIQIQEFADLAEIRQVDIVHYPFFDLFQRTLPLQKKFPTVVTVHDVIPLVFPQHYPSGIKGLANNFYQKMSLRNVAAVITDSEHSKKDIVRYLGIHSKKVFPIYLGPQSFFRQINDAKQLGAAKEKYHLPEKFAVFVGSVNWNKNLVNLTKGTLEAGIDLVVVGRDFENRDHLEHPERQSYAEFLQKFSENPKVHILGFVDDEDLVKIVNLAQTLLLPSFYEGFGLPILEAQACGTPVITSHTSSMPEVAGEGALLVNPSSVKEISGSLLALMHHKNLKEQLIKEGLENVSRFSWEKCAQETIEVYKRIVKTTKTSI